MTDYFEKHPVETYPIAINYAGKAPTGAVLISGTWSATDNTDNSDVSGSVFSSPVAVIDGDLAKVRVRNGELKHSYTLSLAANFDTGDVLNDTVIMHVLSDG